MKPKSKLQKPTSGNHCYEIVVQGISERQRYLWFTRLPGADLAATQFKRWYRQETGERPTILAVEEGEA